MIYLTFFEYTQTHYRGRQICHICSIRKHYFVKFKIAIEKIVGRSNQDTEKGVQVSPGPSRAAQDNFHTISIQKLFSYIRL